MNKIPRSFGTHNGRFHADEVTACALLQLFSLIDADKVVRTRNAARLATCEYVCDVGGVYDSKQHLFDHHQAEYQGDMSSAGMILLYLKEQSILTEEQYRFFNEHLIIGVDAHDLGRTHEELGQCLFSHIIGNFAPIDHEPPLEEEEAAFHEAVNFTKGHLRRLLERFTFMQEFKVVVAKSLEQTKECLFFDEPGPWLESFFELGGAEHPAKFIIMPAGKHWKLRGIPPSLEDRMNVRVPLPSEWAGLSGEDLRGICGIEEAIFCHKGRFISVWQSKEAAQKALVLALQNSEVQA